MERRCNAEVRRKVSPVGDIVDLPLDGEGTDIAGTQLATVESQTFCPGWYWGVAVLLASA